MGALTLLYNSIKCLPDLTRKSGHLLIHYGDVFSVRADPLVVRIGELLRVKAGTTLRCCLFSDLIFEKISTEHGRNLLSILTVVPVNILELDPEILVNLLEVILTVECNCYGLILGVQGVIQAVVVVLDVIIKRGAAVLRVPDFSEQVYSKASDECNHEDK